MLASDLARTLAAAPCVVHFIKADGTERRMLTAPAAGGATVRGGCVTVFDAEKGAWRSIRAERVVSVTTMNARRAERPAAAPAPAPVVTLTTSSEWGGGYVGHRNRRARA